MGLESPVWLVRFLKVWFASTYQIRLDEAEFDFDHYPSVNALFTRRLKEGLRPVSGDLVHPCDGMVAQAGAVVDEQLLQAKGWRYSLAELLGSSALARDLSAGDFTTYYLCPTDYHRVHSPVDGRLKVVRHIPGTLWPVNSKSVGRISGLFLKNERIVFEIECVFGLMAVVMVGATNVGKIQTSVGPRWETNLAKSIEPREHIPNPETILKAGQELGVFHMGSTVICIWPRSAGVGCAEVGAPVFMGGSIRQPQS